MKTSKELRTAYKNLEEEIELVFYNISESSSFNFLAKVLADAGEPTDEMDEDEMVDVLIESDLEMYLPLITYYSMNTYKEISGCVLSVEDGIIQILDGNHGAFTEIIKFRYLNTVSKINLIKELEMYNQIEE